MTPERIAIATFGTIVGDPIVFALGESGGLGEGSRGEASRKVSSVGKAGMGAWGDSSATRGVGSTATVRSGESAANASPTPCVCGAADVDGTTGSGAGTGAGTGAVPGAGAIAGAGSSASVLPTAAGTSSAGIELLMSIDRCVCGSRLWACATGGLDAAGACADAAVEGGWAGGLADGLAAPSSFFLAPFLYLPKEPKTPFTAAHRFFFDPKPGIPSGPRARDLPTAPAADGLLM